MSGAYLKSTIPNAHHADSHTDMAYFTHRPTGEGISWLRPMDKSQWARLTLKEVRDWLPLKDQNGERE